MEKFKNFIMKYYKTILSIIVGIFLLYWIIFVLTPLNTMDVQDKNKIESLTNKIDSLSKTQIIFAGSHVFTVNPCLASLLYFIRV